MDLDCVDDARTRQSNRSIHYVLIQHSTAIEFSRPTELDRLGLNFQIEHDVLSCLRLFLKIVCHLASDHFALLPFDNALKKFVLAYH